MRRRQQEVQVMGVVGERIGTAWPVGVDIDFIDRDRRLVGRERVAVAADAVVDVARHVDDVTGAGHQRGEPVSRRLGPFGPIRRLDRVDVEVVKWTPCAGPRHAVS